MNSDRYLDRNKHLDVGEPQEQYLEERERIGGSEKKHFRTP